MKIGLRAGHSDNCTGAIGIVDEHEQMKSYYTAVKSVLEQYGHIVVDCNSNGASANAELSEGAAKANNANVDLFISLHMNASDGQGHGVEAWVSSTGSGAYNYADNLCNNFSDLGFTNREVKTSTGLYEMNHVAAPNIIFEICFCDNQTDIDVYNQYSWEKLAYVFCNAIDSNIPKEPIENNSTSTSKGYVVTTYLPNAYSGYDGVDINYILSYFKDVKTYVRGNSKGVWIETQYLSIEQCNKLKEDLGSLFYSIEQ
jgi:N-acetylmuramoyl-L-alanine amidase